MVAKRPRSESMGTWSDKCDKEVQCAMHRKEGAASVAQQQMLHCRCNCCPACCPRATLHLCSIAHYSSTARRSQQSVPSAYQLACQTLLLCTSLAYRPGPVKAGDMQKNVQGNGSQPPLQSGHGSQQSVPYDCQLACQVCLLCYSLACGQGQSKQETCERTCRAMALSRHCNPDMGAASSTQAIEARGNQRLPRYVQRHPATWGLHYCLLACTVMQIQSVPTAISERGTLHVRRAGTVQHSTKRPT
ncbi:hypothetical protein COO60DRAFT_1473874 [Scenedesmus sp. NREL 46B-D3]|nr:hypothetical protein COO60DRAFT_1473874 [Scenedesmus sp. NREL 46B-D3]